MLSVSHNALSAPDLPKLIASVHTALVALGGVVEVEPAVELKPAVPVKKSITPEYLICLEDGKKFKSLKRHLRTEYDMSPEEYRAKWGLPPDYPMVAPTYSEARSRLAKTIGAGAQAQDPRRAQPRQGTGIAPSGPAPDGLGGDLVDKVLLPPPQGGSSTEHRTRIFLCTCRLCLVP